MYGIPIGGQPFTFGDIAELSAIHDRLGGGASASSGERLLERGVIDAQRLTGPGEVVIKHRNLEAHAERRVRVHALLHLRQRGLRILAQPLLIGLRLFGRVTNNIAGDRHQVATAQRAFEHHIRRHQRPVAFIGGRNVVPRLAVALRLGRIVSYGFAQSRLVLALARHQGRIAQAAVEAFISF